MQADKHQEVKENGKASKKNRIKTMKSHYVGYVTVINNKIR